MDDQKRHWVRTPDGRRVCVEDAEERFRWRHRHLMHSAKKLQRRLGPLIRCLERARQELAGFDGKTP